MADLTPSLAATRSIRDNTFCVGQERRFVPRLTQGLRMPRAQTMYASNTVGTTQQLLWWGRRDICHLPKPYIMRKTPRKAHSLCFAAWRGSEILRSLSAISVTPHVTLIVSLGEGLSRNRLGCCFVAPRLRPLKIHGKGQPRFCSCFFSPRVRSHLVEVSCIVEVCRAPFVA